MTDKKVWFITGAGRGMGVDIAKAALAAGKDVVATGRSTDTVRAALGHDELILAANLDVTDPRGAEAAVQAAVDQFGRIDVLVNSAGNFNAGFFEEITPEDFRAQIETTLFGPINVTRVVLPVMRAQRSAWSSRSLRPLESWARSSAAHTPPPSSGLRAGSSR